MKMLIFLASQFVAAGPVAGGCGESLCDCSDGLVGLVVKTDQPVTKVTLSGTACSKDHFRCIPVKVDDQIHDECKELQVEAQAEGSCKVDLTVGGVSVRVEQRIPLRSLRTLKIYSLSGSWPMRFKNVG